MTHPDDEEAMGLLNRAVAALREAPVPEGPPPGLVASTVEALQSARTPPEVVRLEERRRIMIRIARRGGLAAAVLLLMALAVSFWLVDRAATTAFAGVVANIKKAESVSFVIKQKHGDRPEPESKLYFHGDRFRYLLPGGDSELVGDLRRRKGLLLRPRPRTAREVDLKDHMPAGELRSPIEELQKLSDGEAVRLADEVVDGRRYQVYRVKAGLSLGVLGGEGEWKVWVDPDTRLPSRLLLSNPDGSHFFSLEEFTWNRPFDAELFDLELPEGYRLGDE